jgi:hypothetical protein
MAFSLRMIPNAHDAVAASRINGIRLLSLEPEESPGHQGCDARRWHLAAAHWLNGDTGTSRFHGSSLTVQPSDFILYQMRRASERSRVIIRAFAHRRIGR